MHGSGVRGSGMHGSGVRGSGMQDRGIHGSDEGVDVLEVRGAEK